MAQKEVLYQSTSLLPCGSCTPASVIICLPPELINPRLCADGISEQTYAYRQIEARILSVCRSSSCGSTLYTYTLDYNEDLVIQDLTSRDILGIFCKQCNATWVEDLVGNEISLEQEDNVVTITTQHGCELSFNIASTDELLLVTDTESINLTINNDLPQILSADVNVSADADNIIEVHADGLYAAVPGGAGWLIVGNAGTDDTVNFLGTTDNEDLEIRVNNNRAMRYIVQAINDGAPDILGGYSGNTLVSDLSLAPNNIGGHGNAILSGGHAAYNNTITPEAGSFITAALICGGRRNSIAGTNFTSDNSVIVGGEQNIIDGCESSIIAGGVSGEIDDSDESVICGGSFNLIGTLGDGSFQAFIGGGGSNNILDSLTSSILGGSENVITLGNYAAILGGANNTIDGSYSSHLGGDHLKLGATSVGFQKRIDGVDRDLTAFSSIGFFGDIDLWIGNTDSTARKLKLFEPNADLDYSSTNYSSLQAQAQAANIEYVLPAAAGVAGDLLSIQGILGTVATLEWISGSSFPANLLPDISCTYDIGSALFQWKDLYLCGEVILSASVIRTSTIDGADNHVITVAGGGAVDTQRGGYITVTGNENALPGYVQLKSGAVTNNRIQLALGSSTGAVEFLNSASAVLWSINHDGTIVQNATNGSDLVFNTSPGIIRLGTSDGADNKRLSLNGGGASADESRGGFILISGNEAAAAGSVLLYAGNVASVVQVQLLNASSRFVVNDNNGGVERLAITRAGAATLFGDVTVGTTAASRILDITDLTITGRLRVVNGDRFYVGTNSAHVMALMTSGTQRWSINTSGQIVQDGTNGAEIVFSKDHSAGGTTGIIGADNKARVGVTPQTSISTSSVCLLLEGTSSSGSGAATLSCGASGSINFRINNSGSGAVFRNSSNAALWTMTHAGLIEQDATNGSNIIMTKASTSVAQPVAATVTAAGANSAAATLLAAVVNNITAGAASTGVRAYVAPTGTVLHITNNTATSKLVYPDTGGTINGGAVDAGITLVLGTGCALMKVAALTWVAYSTGASSLDPTLVALAAYNTNGLMTQTAADTFTGRTITGTTDVVTVTNGDGVSGNPVLDLDDDFMAGWVPITDSWTYASATIVNVPSGAAARYQVGMKVHFVQSAADKYFYITTVADTALGLTGGDTHTVANVAISSIQVSCAASPAAFPSGFPYTPTLTGFSANPTFTAAFSVVGRLCWMNFTCSVVGTSNSTAFTVSLPITSLGGPSWSGGNAGSDNSAARGDVQAQVSAAASVANLFTQGGLAGWTAAGTKSAHFSIVYPI